MRRFLCLLVILASGLPAQQPPAVPVERLLAEGERALASGDYPAAEAAYRKVVQMSPGLAEAHGRLGLILYQQTKFEEAVPELRQALKLKPSLPNTDVLLAMSLAETGQFAAALPGLEKGFRKQPDPALKRMCGLQLQRACTALGKDSQAAEVALELSRAFPEDPEVLYHTSRIFGNFAYLKLKRLAEVAPESVWRRQAQGEAFESQGQWELAIAEYRRVLDLEPNRPGAHYRLGRAILLQSRDADPQGDARREFERELAADPSNANAAYELAEMDRKAGRAAQALEFFETALKYDEAFEEARVGIGRVLLSQGRAREALPHLKRAVELNARNETAFFRLAQACQALGDAAGRQEALAAFQKLRAARGAAELSRGPRGVTPQGADPE